MVIVMEAISSWHKLQSYFNTVNHILNGIAAFYMTLYSIRQGWQAITWHIFLTTIGYQLLMTEAIAALYSPNSWTRFHSRKTKKRLHLALQSMATAFIIIGNVIMIVIKKTPHFRSAHAITGNWISARGHRDNENVYRKLSVFPVEGLISMALLVISVLQGFGAFFATELRRFVNPIYSKFLHNLTSSLCLLVGMASLIYGYLNGMMILYSTNGARYTLIAIAVVTSIFSLIGPTRSAFILVKLQMKMLHQRASDDDKLPNLERA